MNKHITRNKRGIRIFAYTLLGVVGFFAIAYMLITASADNPPLPPPPDESVVTYDDVMNHLTNTCILYTSTDIDITKLVNGDDLPPIQNVTLYFTTKDKNKEVGHTVPFNTRPLSRDSSRSDDGDLFKKVGPSSEFPNDRTFYQMQDSAAFGGGDSNYYMSLLVYSLSGKASIKWFYKITNNEGDFNNEAYSKAKNESGQSLFGRAVKNPSDRPEDNTQDGRNAWMAKLAGSSLSPQCAIVKGSPGTNDALRFTSVNKPSANGKTVALQQSTKQGSKTWYYVARGNWTPPTGATVDGFIYRNNNQYVMINNNGEIIGTHLVDAVGKGWETGTNTTLSSLPIQNFIPPHPIVSSSQTYNHIKLPSTLGDAGSNFIAKFNPPLTDTGFISSVTGVGTGDVNTKDKNMTIEAQLDSPSGPFVNKELININDNGTGSYAESDKGGFGNTNDIYILENKDLSALYGSGAIPLPHLEALVETLVICVHKQLNSGWVSQFVSLKLQDSTTGYSFSDKFNGVKKAQDQSEGVSDWTGTQSLYTLNTETTRKCGSEDDSSVIQQLLNKPAQSAYDNIMTAILNAINALGALIQKAIISVASWVIKQMSENIPI